MKNLNVVPQYEELRQEIGVVPTKSWKQKIIRAILKSPYIYKGEFAFDDDVIAATWDGSDGITISHSRHGERYVSVGEICRTRAMKQRGFERNAWLYAKLPYTIRKEVYSLFSDWYEKKGMTDTGEVWSPENSAVLALYKACRYRDDKFMEVLRRCLQVLDHKGIQKAHTYKTGVHYGDIMNLIIPRTWRQVMKYRSWIDFCIAGEGDPLLLHGLNVHVKGKLLLGSLSDKRKLKASLKAARMLNVNTLERVLTLYRDSSIEQLNSVVGAEFNSQHYDWLMSDLGRIPRDKTIRNNVPVSMMNRKNFSILLKNLKRFDCPEEHDKIALIVMSMLGHTAPMWENLSIHSQYIQLSNILTMDIDKVSEFGNYIWKRKNQISPRDVYTLGNSLNELFSEFGTIKDTKIGALLAHCQAYRYVMPDNNENTILISLEAGRWQLSQNTFEIMCNIMGDAVESSLPKISFVTSNGYRIYQLDHTDPRQLTLGQHTNCCQSIGGAGESCAIYGTTMKNSCFYVAEKNGNIVAQTWAWETDRGICFDNIEALSRAYDIRSWFVDLASRITAVTNKMVTVGVGYSDIAFDGLKKAKRGLVPPSGVYSDARDTQYILSGKEYRVE